MHLLLRTEILLIILASICLGKYGLTTAMAVVIFKWNSVDSPNRHFWNVEETEDHLLTECAVYKFQVEM